MWLAFILTVAFIFYGSVYPFDFQSVSLNSGLFEAFLDSWRVRSPRGDAFGNVALFLPLGGIGILAFPRITGWIRVTLVGACGLVVATGSQFAQFYVPSRVPTLQDVLWNMLGLSIGLALGAVAAAILRRWQRQRNIAVLDPIPLFLIGLWLALRLVPFVPTIDLQAYKDSLKPLLLDPVFALSPALIGAAGWLCVTLLLMDLRGSRHGAITLVVLGIATLALEVVIVANSVEMSDIVALVIAFLLFVTYVHRAANPAAVVAALIVIALVYNGLEPFQLRGEIGRFRWVPFGATLSGELIFGIKVILLKLFLYSALTWFLEKSRADSRLFAVFAATGLVVGIEVAQLFFTSHTAEITDPILVLVCASIIYAARSGRVHVGAYRATAIGD